MRCAILQKYKSLYWHEMIFREERDTLKKQMIGILAAILLLVCGCGDDKAGSFVTSTYYNPASTEVEETESAETETPEAEDDTQSLSASQFMIIQNDMQSESLILEQMASGKQYMYYYSLTTSFLDKYGNRCSVSQFDPGRIITIGSKDSQGRIMQAQISDQVWEYPEITKYAVDEERGVFQIAGTNYSYDDDLYVNSDGTTLQLSDLTQMDTLRAIGVGKKLLSISVTSGHGELQLTNTELFEGSYIQIGSRIFEEITPNMTLELPEGTYTVAVANKGYGGSTEITLERGEAITLDLDTLKGEGPKTGKILFAVDVVGAMLQIDGHVIDYSEPVELQYGVHAITVTATGYETYSKKLFVNSSEATIVIGLSDSDTSSQTSTASDTTTDTTTDSATDSSATAGSLAGSLAGSHDSSTSTTSGNSSSSSQLTDALDEATVDAMVNEILGTDSSSSTDYLSTLSELLKTITGDE
jgi:hypothetical protein